MSGRSYKRKRIHKKTTQEGGALQNTETLLALKEIKEQINNKKQSLSDTFRGNVINPISFAIQLSNTRAATVEGILYHKTIEKLDILMGLFDSIEIQYNRALSQISKPYYNLIAYYKINAPTPAYTEFINVFSLEKIKTYKEYQETLSKSIRKLIETRQVLVHDLNAYNFYFEHILNSTNTLFQKINELGDDISAYCTALISPTNTQNHTTFTQLTVAMAPIISTKYIRAVIDTDTLYTGIPYLQTDASGALLTEEYAIPILSKIYGDALTTFFTVLPPFTETQLEYLSPEIMPVIHSLGLNNDVVPRTYKNSIISCSSPTLYSPGIVLPHGALKTGDYFIIHNNQEESPLIVKIPTADGYFPYLITPSALTVFFYTDEESDYFYGFYSLKDSPIPVSPVTYVSIDSASQMPLLCTERGTPLYDIYGYMKTLSVPEVEINGKATYDLSEIVIMRPPYSGYTRFTPIYSQNDILRSPYAVQIQSAYVFCNEHGYPILDISGYLMQVPGTPSVQGMYAMYTEPGEEQSRKILILSNTINTTRPIKVVDPLIDIAAKQFRADIETEGAVLINRCTSFFKDINDLIKEYSQKETIFQNFLSVDQSKQLAQDIVSLQNALSSLDDEKTTFDSIIQSYPLAETNDDYTLVNRTTRLQVVKIEAMFTSLSPTVQNIESLFSELKEVNTMEQEIKKITESVTEFVRKAEAMREHLGSQLQIISNTHNRDVENTLQDIYVDLSVNMKTTLSINESLPTLKTIDALREALGRLRILYKTSNEMYTSLESMKTKQIPDIISTLDKNSKDFLSLYIQYTVPYLKFAVDISSEIIRTPEMEKSLKEKGYPPFFWNHVKQFIHDNTRSLYKSTLEQSYTDTLASVQGFLNKYTESYISQQNPVSIQQAISDDLIPLYDKIKTLEEHSDAFIKTVNALVLDSIKKQYSDISLKLQEFIHYIVGVSLFSDTYSPYIKDAANYQEFTIELKKATDIDQTLTIQKNKLDAAYKIIMGLVVSSDFITKPEVSLYMNIYQETISTHIIAQPIFTQLQTLMTTLSDTLRLSITDAVTKLKAEINATIPMYTQNSKSMEQLTVALQDSSIQPTINISVINAFKDAYTSINATLSNMHINDAMPQDISALLATKTTLETLKTALVNQNATILINYKLLQKSANDAQNKQVIGLISSLPS